jgi:phage anti-repressor protein
MLEINSNNMVLGEEIHAKIESKLKDYSIWVKRKIEDADLKEGEDFSTILLESTGGRPKTQYEFTLDAAKEICLLEKNHKGKDIRRWLIKLSTQRENLELVTIKEAAFAMKVVNCLKYIENQKESYTIHKNTFAQENADTLDPKFIYAEFSKYRAKIVGWDKEKADQAIQAYLLNHAGYNRAKLIKKDMSTKLSIMDIGEAIRVAVLDILYSKHEDSKMAENFSILCKKLAKEMGVSAEKENQKNLFRDKEKIDSVKQIMLSR